METWAREFFWVCVAVVAVGVPLYAARVRGSTYAGFAAVILLFSLPGALWSEARLAGLAGGGSARWVSVGFALGTLAAGWHLAHLVRARLRGPVFRWLVSVPGQAFVAAGFVAIGWALLLSPFRLGLWAAGADAWLTALRWLDLVPFVLALGSIRTSLLPRVEHVQVQLAPAPHDRAEAFVRAPVVRQRGWPAPAASGAEPGLRIVQITDPHLGPWQPVARLQRSLESLLESDPDLVLLTGDFLTMEGQGTPGALGEALAPLRAVQDRCYAIFGNHDHEAPDEVRGALEQCGADLLIDDARRVDTRCGPVQIIGADYVGRGRGEHLAGLLARFPREPDALRLLLLHDPLGFREIAPGEVDLTLSGHTHGGQVGLVSFGLDWTVLGRTRWPDHGFFAQGSNRLYVHRGTGFYGFPLRIGVPGEHSVLELLPHATR
ncbi:MAG: metallophosphoesterase [Myxococcota bacterium]